MKTIAIFHRPLSSILKSVLLLPALLLIAAPAACAGLQPASAAKPDGAPHRARVRLTGVPVYEVTEIFNDILVSSPGVTDVKRLRLVIDPRHPRACEAVWSVALEGTNLFRLESRVFNRLRAVAIEEGGEGDPAFTFQPCLADRTLLSRIRPWSASAHEIHFVLCDPDPTDPAAFRGPQWRSGVETVMPGSKGFE